MEISFSVLKKNNLSPVVMLQLLNLFKKMNWPISEGELTNSLYERYCERLKMLDAEGQNLFLELSYKFQRIEFVTYLEDFLMSFHLLDENLLKTNNKIIFSPLINPYVNQKEGQKKYQRTKTKSSQFLYYLMSAHDLRWIDYSSKFFFAETMSEIKKEFVKGQTLLILIDDFIGSGGTAVQACQAMIDEGIASNDMVIVSIAAMERGVDYIKDELGVVSYSNIIKRRGITDCYSEIDAPEKRRIMLSMEKSIVCPKDYSMGFKASESLITFMNKTPNNTFPVFWYETSTKIAPFPRYKIYR